MLNDEQKVRIAKARDMLSEAADIIFDVVDELDSDDELVEALNDAGSDAYNAMVPLDNLPQGK